MGVWKSWRLKKKSYNKKFPTFVDLRNTEEGEKKEKIGTFQYFLLLTYDFNEVEWRKEISYISSLLILY